MWLERCGELGLSGARSLHSEFAEGASGAGRLQVELVSPSYDTVGKATWDLEPWSPEAFLVYEWVPGNAFVICGATRLLVVEMSTLAVCGVIVSECEEFRVRSTPWFVANDELLVIGSESRVFCVDRRVALRRVWSTAAFAVDCWMISEPPILEPFAITVRIVRMNQQRELRLRVSDALVLPA
jgi:hypothetical protein